MGYPLGAVIIILFQQASTSFKGLKLQPTCALSLPPLVKGSALPGFALTYLQVVNDVLTGCSTLDERQQCMGVLLRSQPAVRGIHSR